MQTEDGLLRLATAVDLAAVNQVVEAAVMSWSLPERVKRLSLSSYRYDAADLMHLTLLVAEGEGGKIVAVAAWESAENSDLPANTRGLLLHGLYVLPTLHGRGLGQRLLRCAEREAVKTGFDGILVKAQAEAVGFFQYHNYQLLPVEDRVRHYSHRLWKAIAG